MGKYTEMVARHFKLGRGTATEQAEADARTEERHARHARQREHEKKVRTGTLPDVPLVHTVPATEMPKSAFYGGSGKRKRRTRRNKKYNKKSKKHHKKHSYKKHAKKHHKKTHKKH